MASAKSKSFFTNDELATLRRAFELAAADLGLSPADDVPRTRLSALVFDVARTGVSDCVTLRAQAVARFKDPAAGRRDEARSRAPGR